MTATVWHHQRTGLTAVAFVIFASLIPQTSNAAILYVGTCTPTIYLTIQSAVNAAAAGSTIRVCPGGYPEQVVINQNLILSGIDVGDEANPTIVIPSAGFVANATSLTNGLPVAAQILVQSPATQVNINNIAVDGSGSNLNSGCTEARLIGIYYQGASGTVNHVAVRNQAQNAENFGCADSAGLGIFIESNSSENSTVAVENSAVRGYQKNGITADEMGTTVTVRGNSVIGAGPSNAAQNGIQIAFGAAGEVINNTVADDVFNNPALGIGVGILVYASGNTTVMGNSVTNTQTGIATETSKSLTADGNNITSNLVANTHIGDGIDLCSDNNVATRNTVFSSDNAGIHLDSTCGSTGNGNTITNNSVNDACVGLLLGTETSTTRSGNSYFNVAHAIIGGDLCPAMTMVPDIERERDQTDAMANSLRSTGHDFIPARP